MGHYSGICLALLAGVWAAQAQAGCLQGQELFTSCQIADRNTEVSVCSDDQVATYSYGPIGGAPDLVLSQSIKDVDFKPWSGVGKEIAENITFYNGDYGYDVFGGFDRPFSDAEMLLENRHFGGISITKNGERISTLTCIPETVSYGFPSSIYDAKMTAGLIWDDHARVWLYDPSHAAAPSVRGPVLMQEPPSRGADDCLPAAAFKLGDIMMGDPVATVSELGLSEHTELTMEHGLAFQRYVLDGLSVDVAQGSVMEMSAITPQWQMPSGVRVGLPRQDVIHILGRVPNGRAVTAQIFSTSVCMADHDDFAKWYAVIVFGHDSRVQSINFASFSP